MASAFLHFEMFTNFEVQHFAPVHPGAPANASNIFVFSTIFNVREISIRLVEKLNKKPTCLRVFATRDAASNPADDGESMIDICASIFSDKVVARSLVTQGGFSFVNEGGSTVIMHLRLDALARTHLVREIESCLEAVVSSGISPGVGFSVDDKGRKRISS